MTEAKVFRSYDYLTGDVADSFVYDVPVSRPRRVRPETVSAAPARERAAVKTGLHVSPLTVAGCALAAVLLVLTLLARIQLTALSATASGLQTQITQLDRQKLELTAEYESRFNLALVEEYAKNQLNMQPPRADQVRALTGVSGESRAVVLTPQKTDMFTLGLRDLMQSLEAYFH